MNQQAKISPAFEPFLADSGTADKREAIVVLRGPDSGEPPVRGRLRTLKQRLNLIKQRSDAQKPVQQKLFESYQRLSKTAPLGPLTVSEIGGSELRVAAVEVTAKTLPGLAERPEVLAILPNQKIHLIKPKEVDYAELGRQESKDGLTWGLKHLQIPELWKTTKRKEITVAVLDTGVYGAHPALADRVKEFVVIDPLGRRIVANPSFDSGSHGTHVCGTIAGGNGPSKKGQTSSTCHSGSAITNPSLRKCLRC
jgi:subtilisin family serine protease